MNLPALALLFAAVLPSTKLPFTVEAVEDVSSEFPGAPKIQSFAFGQWKGKWVFIGGRSAGYHSVGGGMAEFQRADANRDVWVVDTTVKPAKTYHAPLEKLPATLNTIKDQWSAAALAFVQDGAKLYIAGGYGLDHAGKWITFPVLSRVDLPMLVEGVMKGRIPVESIAMAKSPLVQSTAGQLVKLPDGFFYLVMGHNFTGSYTAFEGHEEKNTQPASQEYLSEIRKLSVTAAADGSMTVALVQKYHDEDQFHRRDLNITPIMSPKGVGIAAYGGVFTPKEQLNYSKPIYMIGPAAKPVVDTRFEQQMAAYSCPVLLMYDKASETMFTTFFGGISRHYWDPEGERFVEFPKQGSKTESTYLDGMQWSDQISTIRKSMGAGKTETAEIVHPGALPGFLGTDGIFIPAAEVKRAAPDSEIISYESLSGTHALVGYIYGGIRAFPYRFPYMKGSTPYNAGTIPTKPSEVILKVYVDVAAQQVSTK